MAVQPARRLVAAEAVEVFVQIRARAGKGFRGYCCAVPVGGEAIERPCHAEDGVEDKQFGNEVVVFDHLALFVALGGGW